MYAGCCISGKRLNVGVVVTIFTGGGDGIDLGCAIGCEQLTASITGVICIPTAFLTVRSLGIGECLGGVCASNSDYANIGEAAIYSLNGNGSSAMLQCGNYAVLNGSDSLIAAIPSNSLVGCLVRIDSSNESCRLVVAGIKCKSILIKCYTSNRNYNVYFCAVINGLSGELFKVSITQCYVRKIGNENTGFGISGNSTVSLALL